MRSASRTLFHALPELVDRVRYLPYWERGAFAFAVEAAKIPIARTVDRSFLTFPSARAHYAVVAGLVRAGTRYMHDYPEARRVVRFIRNVRLVPIAQKHNVLRNMDLLRSAGIDAEDPTRYVIPQSWRDEGPRDARQIVMHVGSIAHDGFELKRWPESSFADLARRLVAHGYDVALLSGPDEREITDRVRVAAPGTTLLEGSLPEISRRLSRVALVVANDNGIAHLGTAVGTPVVSLFGPTPLFHAPFGPTSRPLRPSSCPPCFDPLRRGMTCLLGIDYRCLKVDLSVDIAEEATLSALRTNREETVPSTR